MCAKIAWFVSVLLLITCSSAFARNVNGQHTASTNSGWYAAQYNGNGQWCCDVSDGHEYDGDYVMNPDGSVTIDPLGANRRLPAYMVLKGPNPTGHAVWWYVESPSLFEHIAPVAHTDYCFAPGAGG